MRERETLSSSVQEQDSLWRNSGTSISLSPTPSGGNTFSLWTGDISSLNAPLSFTMDGPKDITAEFNSVASNGKTVRIAGLTPTYYDSIALAYANATTIDDKNVIQTRALTYVETLNFARTDITEVTLKGGYNATFSDNSEMSIVGSPLTIGRGTITLDNIEIQ